MDQYDAVVCFRSSCGYFVVQSYRGTVVSPVSGFSVGLVHMYLSVVRMCHGFLLFFEESDTASLRTRHRRQAREIAAQMSRTTLQEVGDREPAGSSRTSTSRRSGPRVRKSTPAAAVAVPSVNPRVVRSPCSNQRPIQKLMDLALPKFACQEGRSSRPHLPWIVTTDSPASPAPVHLRAPLILPSHCLNLDMLSSDESAGPGHVSDVPICISDASSPPSNPDQVLTDDDLPTVVCADE